MASVLVLVEIVLKDIGSYFPAIKKVMTTFFPALGKWLVDSQTQRVRALLNLIASSDINLNRQKIISNRTFFMSLVSMVWLSDRFESVTTARFASTS